MDSVKEITVEPVPEVTDEVRVLLGELDRILAAEYPPEQRHGLSLDEIFNPGVRFFLARSNGCSGGVRRLRILRRLRRGKAHVCSRSRARPRGGQALLARIEREARDSGLVLLRLETGTRQTAALTFYRRAGFQPCAAFGAYATMAAPAIATSVFLEKLLSE